MRGGMLALLGRAFARRERERAAMWSIHRYCGSSAAEQLEEEPAEDPNAKLEVIYAVPRDDSGRNMAKKIRKAKRIPSIVFSQEDGHLGGHKQLLTLDHKQMTYMVKRIGQSFFMSRLYMLETRTDPNPKEGELIIRERVLPRLLHVHPVTDEIINVTFIRAPPYARLKVDVPLVFAGQDTCIGIKKGGYLNTIRRTVKYLSPPDQIPKFIEVDLSGLDVNRSVRVKELPVGQGMVIYDTDPNWPVCKIVGSRATRTGPPSSDK